MQNKSIPEVESLLSPLELPIAYEMFVPYDDVPVPYPPYIVYLAANEASGGGDKINLYKRVHVRVELYTDKPDDMLEQQVEDALVNIAWTKDCDDIEAEALHVVYYEFDLYMKRRNRNV